MAIFRTEVNLTDTSYLGYALVPDSLDDQTKVFEDMLALLGTETGTAARGSTGVLPREKYYVKGNFLSRLPFNSSVTLRGDGANASIIARFPDMHYKAGATALQDLLSTATSWTYSSATGEIQISAGTSAQTTTLPKFVCSSSNDASKLKVHYKTNSAGFVANSKFRITVDSTNHDFNATPSGGADAEITLTAGTHTIQFTLHDGGASGLAISVDDVRVTNARLTSDAYYVGNAPGEASLGLQSLLSMTTPWKVSATPASERGLATLHVASTGSAGTRDTTTPSIECAANSVLKFSCITFLPGFPSTSLLKVFVDGSGTAILTVSPVAGTWTDLSVNLGVSAGRHTIKFQLTDSIGIAGDAIAIQNVRITDASQDDLHYIDTSLDELRSADTAWFLSPAGSQRGAPTLDVKTPAATSVAGYLDTTTPTFLCNGSGLLTFSRKMPTPPSALTGARLQVILDNDTDNLIYDEVIGNSGWMSEAGAYSIPAGPHSLTFRLVYASGNPVNTLAVQIEEVTISGAQLEYTTIFQIQGKGGTATDPSLDTASFFNLRDITLDGGLKFIAATGANDPASERPLRWFLLEGAAQLRFDRVLFAYTHGTAIEGRSWWDSTIHNVDFAQCGRADDVNNVTVRNSRAALVLRRLGYSGTSLTCNNLKFEACRWEGHPYIACLLEQYTRKIFFSGCKWHGKLLTGGEPSPVTYPQVDILPNCYGISFLGCNLTNWWHTHIRATQAGILVTGCDINAAGSQVPTDHPLPRFGFGIDLQDCENCSIINNHFPVPGKESINFNGDIRITGGENNVPPFMEELLQPAPLSAMRIWDSLASNLPATANPGNLGLVSGTIGTNRPVLETSDANSATPTTQHVGFEISVPLTYLPNDPIKVLIDGVMRGRVATNSATVDLQLYREVNGAADLCASPAQSINAIAAATRTFNITPIFVVPGDVLRGKATVAISDAGGGLSMFGRILSITPVFASRSFARVNGVTPRTVWRDDFTSGGTTSGTIGELGWLIDNSTASLAVTTFQASPNSYIRGTCSAATGVCGLRLGDVGNIVDWSTDFDVVFVVKFPQYNSGNNDIQYRFGLTSDTAANFSPTNAFSIVKSAGGTNWIGSWRSGGSNTPTSAITGVNTNQGTFRIYRKTTTEIGFCVEGIERTLTGVTTPVGKWLSPFIQFDNPGALSGQTFELDFFQLAVKAL